MKLELAEPRVDGPLETHWDALIRIVGLFAVIVGEKRWYAEQDFCLVEFAKDLIDWLDQLALAPIDFVYSSLESAEPELLRFIYVGDGKWRLSSPHEAYREQQMFPTDSLKSAVLRYLKDLRDRLPERDRVLALLAEKEENGRLLHLLSGDPW